MEAHAADVALGGCAGARTDGGDADASGRGDVEAFGDERLLDATTTELWKDGESAEVDDAVAEGCGAGTDVAAVDDGGDTHDAVVTSPALGKIEVGFGGGCIVGEEAGHRDGGVLADAGGVGRIDDFDVDVRGRLGDGACGSRGIDGAIEDVLPVADDESERSEGERDGSIGVRAEFDARLDVLFLEPVDEVGGGGFAGEADADGVVDPGAGRAAGGAPTGEETVFWGEFGEAAGLTALFELRDGEVIEHGGG